MMKQLMCLLFSILPWHIFADELPSKRQGELLYLLKQDCGSCHGMTLRGGLGPPLLPNTLTVKPSSLLVQTILKGRPQTAMPPWQGILNEPEAQWLVNMLKKGIP